MLAIEMLLKGTALLALVFAVATVLRSASAATRHLVWSLGLVGLVGLPLLSAVTPWRLDVVPEIVRFQAPDAATEAARSEAPATTRDESGAATSRDAAAVRVSPATPAAEAADRAQAANATGSAGARPSAATVLLAIWGIGVLLVASRWITGARSLRRCIRGARPVSGEGWDEPLRQAADRLLLDTPVRLLVSDRVPMPLTAGVVRPVVILPEAAMEWTADRRRAVIVHELAHIQRKDILSHALGWFACAAWWFHPLAWSAA